MNCLLLSLRGSIRSWGATSVGDDRWTQQWPTASAILGLVGACMGVDHHSPIQVKAWYSGFLVCTLSAVSYEKSQLLGITSTHRPVLFSDYHTTSNSLTMADKPREHALISHRGYISDGLDVAALIPKHNEGELWLEQLVFALQQPKFTPYLGRRSNPLSAPLTNPEETVLHVDSTEDLCERLFSRLSALSVGDLKPTKCLLRLPTELDDKNSVLLNKWNDAGTDVIAEHRSGSLRTFKNRTVRLYRRDFKNE
ncbi:MAG: type I-E CRISPR-associated protein Cas5/CasD [Desulfobulbus sp.]|nr:type I-E CRISPR-associated protein Cas5/CasD [Desulfobulbus sp.]